jgi:hypothetical protein
MDEQHGSNQKLQWMSDTVPNKRLQWMSNTDPNKKLQWMSNTDPTKNYNGWATRTQPKTTMDERHGANQKLQ